jgi:hypothetical protein
MFVRVMLGKIRLLTLTQIKGQTRPPQTEGRFEFNGLHWMTSFFKKDCSVTSKELRRVLRRSMRSAREWSLTTAGTDASCLLCQDGHLTSETVR